MLHCVMEQGDGAVKQNVESLFISVYGMLTDTSKTGKKPVLVEKSLSSIRVPVPVTDEGSLCPSVEMITLSLQRETASQTVGCLYY